MSYAIISYNIREAMDDVLYADFKVSYKAKHKKWVTTMS